MDVYKGTGAFSGIAIGKILYYHKSEYQMRQYEITDVKTELNIFRQARTRVMEQLEDLYEKNCIIQGTQAEIFLRQKNLLEGKSFQRAIESVIQSEKVNSAYAVMTTRDEMLKTFRTLEEPAIKERLDNMREISDRLIGELGGISPRIDLGDKPVIVVTELLKLRREPDITKDGRKIEIYANIGNMDDLNSVLYYGAAGIGLLRSEFQYLGRENYPRENELFLAYKKIAETMGEKLTVIRTADLGADKQAEYLNIPDETNPIMGNRGIRLCLDRKRMFKAQLRAIFRASAYGNLALMYPMISSEEEMDEIEEIIREVKIGLDEKGIPYKHIKTGIMIETPAAVMISRELARRVDFLSLGTNDLSQYTLAMDRQNPLLRKKYNDHHPAVLRMIQMVIEAGHAENRRVCICGELAADTALTEEFLRMGVDCLSVVPACILPVRKALRQVDLSGDDKGA